MSVVERAEELLGRLHAPAEDRTRLDRIGSKGHDLAVLAAIVAVEVVWLAAFAYAAYRWVF